MLGFTGYPDIRSIFRYALITIFLTILANILSGMFIFSIQGVIAYELNINFTDLNIGVGLYYESYALGMALMPSPTVAAVIMFIILVLF